MKNATVKLVAVCAASMAATAQVFALSKPDDRSKSIEAIREMLSNEVKPVSALRFEESPNPFSSLVIEEAVLEEKAPVKKELSDQDLLDAFKPMLRPTGIFQIGGENYLVFTERRAKKGSVLSLMYQDKEYKVLVTEIGRSDFSVRLGEAELQLKLK